MFISWTQPAPEGGFDAKTGWTGMTNPAGRRLMLMAMPAVSAARQVSSMRLKSPGPFGVLSGREGRGRVRRRQLASRTRPTLAQQRRSALCSQASRQAKPRPFGYCGPMGRGRVRGPAGSLTQQNDASRSRGVPGRKGAHQHRDTAIGSITLGVSAGRPQ
jgi:hypothetical protein